ncbi:peptidylprolyl isomerase [Termitidicoccus mucosus]|uniref:Peptidylprolyl isomerase n=1 Tax=Termitidicoccus mucosus TaxID=1184151 RepID=A0A178IMB1_9BACT|nr:peptidylprolyl isomerase [Opitutaceae bacterium TSB47]
MKKSSALFLSILSLASVSLSSFAADAGVLARVSDTEVKIDDIRSSLENLSPREQAALSANPALLNQAVRSLLARRVVLNEALAQKWDKNPAFTAQLDKLRENALIESYLQSVSQPPADFPSEADLQAVFEANRPALVAPRQVRLAQIYIAAPKTASQAEQDEARARLDDVRKKLAQPGADFAALARVESDEKQSAASGGELGWLADGQIRPEIRDAVTSLAPGGVSEPVRLDDGWHLLKALEVRETRPLALDEVRVQLVQRLRAERAQANRQNYLTRLMEKNPVSINELALSQVLAPASGQ